MNCSLPSNCVGPTCRHYLDPMPGVVYRVAACVLAIVEGNVLLGQQEMSHADVGRHMGVSPRRIRFIEARALGKIRRALGET